MKFTWDWTDCPIIDTDLAPESGPGLQGGAQTDLSSGIYIARLVTPEYSKSIKMVLLKWGRTSSRFFSN